MNSLSENSEVELSVSDDDLVHQQMGSVWLYLQNSEITIQCEGIEEEL